MSIRQTLLGLLGYALLCLGVQDNVSGQDTSSLMQWERILIDGDFLAESGSYLAAIEAYGTATYLAKAEQDWRGLVEGGKRFAGLGEVKSALAAYDDAFDVAEMSGSGHGMVLAADGFMEIRYPEKGYAGYSMAYDTALKSQDWVGLVGAGDGFARLGEEQWALSAYSQASTVGDGWKSLVAEGKIKIMEGHAVQAMEYLEGASIAAFEERSVDGLVIVADSFANLSEYSAALEGYQIALLLADRGSECAQSIEVGKKLADLNALSDAKEAFSQAEAIGRKIGSHECISGARVGLGKTSIAEE